MTEYVDDAKLEYNKIQEAKKLLNSYQISSYPDELKKIIKLLDLYPQYYPAVLKHISETMIKFSEQAAKKNDITLYNALSIACCMLSSKKRPSDDVVRQLSSDIKEALFKNGIEGHAPGVKDFYNRFIKEETDEN